LSALSSMPGVNSRSHLKRRQSQSPVITFSAAERNSPASALLCSRNVRKIGTTAEIAFCSESALHFREAMRFSLQCVPSWSGLSFQQEPGD
jgi:hypothetical protein